MIEAGLVFVSAVGGAFAFRVRGGYGPDFFAHRQITLGTWSAILTAALWPLVPWYVALAALVATFGATSLPHGSGIDFGRAKADDPTELLRHLWAPADAPSDDAIFMAVRGALMTLPVGIALAVGGEYLLALTGLSGVLMGPAYWIGYEMAVADVRDLPVGAEAGEWITGAALAAACALPWLAA